jgi:hypothetical protein
MAFLASSRIWLRIVVALALLSILLLALLAANSFGILPASPVSSGSGATVHPVSSQIALMRSPNEGCGAVSLPC